MYDLYLSDATPNFRAFCVTGLVFIELERIRANMTLCDGSDSINGFQKTNLEGANIERLPFMLEI